MVDWVIYETLWPECVHRAFVHLPTEAFSRLWAICRSKQLTVVADVHTHLLGCQQSVSDQTYPMLATPGT